MKGVRLNLLNISSGLVLWLETFSMENFQGREKKAYQFREILNDIITLKGRIELWGIEKSWMVEVTDCVNSISVFTWQWVMTMIITIWIWLYDMGGTNIVSNINKGKVLTRSLADSRQDATKRGVMHVKWVLVFTPFFTDANLRLKKYLNAWIFLFKSTNDLFPSWANSMTFWI